MSIDFKGHQYPKSVILYEVFFYVRECHNIIGSIEYLLRVECADMPSYKAFHTDLLGALPQVNGITSYVVMGSPKDERA